MSTYDELAPRLLADDPEQQRVMAAWQEGTRRQADMTRREAEARVALTDRVADAIATALDTKGLELSSPHSLAVAAVDVFIDYLRNPPVREIQPDGTETVRWP